MAESANAAFVRRTYELFNAGDLEGLAAGFEEGFEWHPDELAPAQTARRSADDVVAAIDDFTGAFADFRTEIEELIEDEERSSSSATSGASARETSSGARCTCGRSPTVGLVRCGSSRSARPRSRRRDGIGRADRILR